MGIFDKFFQRSKGQKKGEERGQEPEREKEREINRKRHQNIVFDYVRLEYAYKDLRSVLEAQLHENRLNDEVITKLGEKNKELGEDLNKFKIRSNIDALEARGLLEAYNDLKISYDALRARIGRIEKKGFLKPKKIGPTFSVDRRIRIVDYDDVWLESEGYVPEDANELNRVLFEKLLSEQGLGRRNFSKGLENVMKNPGFDFQMEARLEIARGKPKDYELEVRLFRNARCEVTDGEIYIRGLSGINYQRDGQIAKGKSIIQGVLYIGDDNEDLKLFRILQTP